MNGTFKYIIFVIMSLVIALIITNFHKGFRFQEFYTLEIASLALLRTCEEKK